MITSLRRYECFFGDSFKVESGERKWKLGQMADDLTRRLISLFKLSKGKRPYIGDCERIQKDPLFRDHLLFFEHFHGESGRGLGASHQTGWSALVAKLLEDVSE